MRLCALLIALSLVGCVPRPPITKHTPPMPPLNKSLVITKSFPIPVEPKLIEFRWDTPEGVGWCWVIEQSHDLVNWVEVGQQGQGPFLFLTTGDMGFYRVSPDWLVYQRMLDKGAMP